MACLVGPAASTIATAPDGSLTVTGTRALTVHKLEGGVLAPGRTRAAA